MNPKTVEKLEGKIEEAVAAVVVRKGVKKRTLSPSLRTMYLIGSLPRP